MAHLLRSKVSNGIFKKRDSYGSGCKLINVWDLYQDESIQFDDLERIEITNKEVHDYAVEIGDLLFCRSSLKPEGVAWTSFVETMPEPSVFECHIIRAKPDPTKVLPAFIAYYCKTTLARSYLLSKSTVTTMATIDQQAVGALPVILPPIDVQKKLVDEMEMARKSRKNKLQKADELLGGLDEWLLIKLGLKLIKAAPRTVYAISRSQLENRCDAYYYSPHFLRVAHLIDSCRLPKKSLGDICPDIAGGATPKVGDHGLYDETGTTGIKFLRILNVKPCEIDLNDVKYIEESVHSGELQRSQLRTDDVIMTITGRVGTAAVVTADILPANINQHIVRLRVFDDEVLPEYLAAFLNTSVGLALSNRGVTGGTRIALDYDTIRRLRIPVLDRAMQQTVVNEVRHRRENAQRLRAEAETEWAAAKEHFEAQLLGGSTTRRLP